MTGFKLPLTQTRDSAELRLASHGATQSHGQTVTVTPTPWQSDSAGVGVTSHESNSVVQVELVVQSDFELQVTVTDADSESLASETRDSDPESASDHSIFFPGRIIRVITRLTLRELADIGAALPT